MVRRSGGSFSSWWSARCSTRRSCTSSSGSRSASSSRSSEADRLPPMRTVSMSSARSDAGFSVLHVLAPARYGGLERVVASLAAGQADAGLDSRVLAIVEPGETDHPFLDGMQRGGIPADALVVPPRRYVAERRGVVEWCRRTRPSIVHVHGARPDVLVA